MANCVIHGCIKAGLSTHCGLDNYSNIFSGFIFVPSNTQ
jgi:hypothetical protein